MKNSRLILFLKCLTQEEFKAFLVYLNAESTVVRSKKLTVTLLNCLIEYCNSFEELKTVKKINKGEIFGLVEEELNLKVPISNRNRNDLMSYLVLVIEEFLIIQELKSNLIERNLLLSEVIKKRNAPVLFNQITNKLLKTLNKKPLRNIDNSFFRWRVLHIRYFNSVVSKINSKAKVELQQLTNHLNEFWLLANYVYTIEIKNRMMLFDEKYQYLDIKQLKPHFSYNFISKNHFLLQGYQFIHNLLENENTIFDEVIKWHEDALETTKGGKTTKRTSSEREELFFIHILIINFYAIKSSKGEENANYQLFKVFKTAIDGGILEGAATIDHHYYLIVIRLSLGLKKRSWCNEFIQKNASLVPTNFKDEIQQYVNWLLKYEQRDINDYTSIVHEIHQISSSDTYLEIIYRILEMQILYELSIKDAHYENLLNARLGNFNDWLSNQRLMETKSITVQSNRNFIKIVRKLILSKYRKSVNALYVSSLMNSPEMEHVSERLWLEEQLKQL